MSESAGRVLLAHSYFLAHDAKQVRKMRPYPPLATLITAAILRRQGYAVDLFDAMLASDEGEFASLVERKRPSVVAILEDNFNFLTKMCTTRMRAACLEMIRIAKSAGSRVALNGSDVADNPELYLKTGADAVILGETEATLVALLEAWKANGHGEGLEAVPGLAYRRGSQLHKTPPRPFVEDLDSLPFPAWDLVDVEAYRHTWKHAHGRLSWNVVTTRGCPFHCNWCAKPLYGVRYAQRSPENVAEELRLLKRDVAPDHVWFADDIFGLSPRWIERFATEVAERGARIPFTMQSRVDLMTPSAVEALARAGAEEVWMGVESGSQRVLNSMNKGIAVEEVRAATRALKAHGIKASWFLQLGYPGEDWEDLLATRDLVRSERPDDIGVSVAYPLPGTLFYERVKDQLGQMRNWEDSDDLAMMFEGTYAGPFYKKVRDALHEEAAFFAAAEALPEASARAAYERRLGELHARWKLLDTQQEFFRSTSPTRPLEAVPALATGAFGGFPGRP